ncbi:hypothetical protein KUTG_05743 [Kutzneria sp. 744]|nr:hypothetical protein KUTG_05743 [Kutzneria sp. 744]
MATSAARFQLRRRRTPRPSPPIPPALVVGACVAAQGKADDTGAVAATSIAVSKAGPNGCTGGFRGGRGGFGGGRGGGNGGGNGGGGNGGGNGNG